MGGRRGFAAFYLHRAQRLLPLYYIVVLVTVALHSKELSGSRDWYLELGALLSTLFIFSAHGFMPPSNVVLWSVSVEIWFSALFPVFVLLVQRWRTRNVVIGTIVVCAAFAYIGHSISIERVGYFWPFTNGIFGCCYEFLLGMMVCDLYVKGVENPVLRGKHSQLLLPGALIMVGALYLMHHAAFVVLQILGNIGFAVGFAFVLLSILSGVNPLRRVLENWPLQVLGCMCYSIYAWHGIIMNEMIPPATSSLSRYTQAVGALPVRDARAQRPELSLYRVWPRAKLESAVSCRRCQGRQRPDAAAARPVPRRIFLPQKPRTTKGPPK